MSCTLLFTNYIFPNEDKVLVNFHDRMMFDIAIIYSINPICTKHCFSVICTFYFLSDFYSRNRDNLLFSFKWNVLGYINR